MTDSTPNDISRRALIGAAALAGGAGLVGLPRIAHAVPGPGIPEDLDDPIPGATYLALDAAAFTASNASTLYDDGTGAQPIPAAPGAKIHAALPLPAGAVIKQVNIGFYGAPTVSLRARTLGGSYSDIVAPVSLPAGAGHKTQSVAADAELAAATTHDVLVVCDPGDSITGMTIGYVPPPQAFAPTSASDPRALDTRPDNALAPDGEVTVDLSAYLVPGARAAVFNLTATGTTGPGFLAAFPDGIDWPGNSSVNFSTAGQTVANGVISAVSDGKVTIRAGVSTTHVIVDVIGSML